MDRSVRQSLGRDRVHIVQSSKRKSGDTPQKRRKRRKYDLVGEAQKYQPPLVEHNESERIEHLSRNFARNDLSHNCETSIGQGSVCVRPRMRRSCLVICDTTDNHRQNLEYFEI